MLLFFSFLTLNQFYDVNGQDNQDVICEDFMDPVIIIDEDTPSIYPVGTVITNEGTICKFLDDRISEQCTTQIINIPDGSISENHSCIVSTLSAEKLFQVALGSDLTPQEYCAQIKGEYQLRFPTSQCIVFVGDDSGLAIIELFNGRTAPHFQFMYASCANEINCTPTTDEFPPTLLPISLPFQDNRPPSTMANAIPNPVITDENVILDGSTSSDPDGNETITKYEWHQIDSSNSQVILDNPFSATTSFQAPSNIPRSLSSSTHIPLEFELTVTDDTGLSDSDQITVDIQCSSEDLEKIDNVKQDIAIVLGIWRDIGYVHSIDGFNIWLSGNQHDILSLDVNWLRDQNSVESAEIINEHRIQKGDTINKNILNLFPSLPSYSNWLRDNGFVETADIIDENIFNQESTSNDVSLIDLVGKAVQTGEIQTLQGNDGKWDRVIESRILITDFDYRVGSGQLTSQAKISVIPLGGNQIQIIGEVKNTLPDTYNFNPGVVFLGLLSADDLNLLKKCELAKDYEQKGEWTKVINVTDDLPNILNTLNSGKLPFTFN